MQPKDLKPILNVYGDSPSFSVGDAGYDISSIRLDELDYECLTYVISHYTTSPVGIDLGCGLGVPSISFSLAGAQMLLVDKLNFEDRFAQISTLIPSLRLSFQCCDLTKNPADISCADLDLIYSQRMIHYLRYQQALELLTLLARKLKPGGQCFISASGLASELSQGYERGSSVTERYSRLSEKMAQTHRIHNEVCLYSADDLEELGIRAGLRKVRIWESPFGNVKGHFEKPVAAATS